MKARLFVSSLIALAFASTGGPALASEQCTGKPREQWKPEADVRAATEALGYKVTNIKADGGCYDVRAADKNGKRFELKFDPVDMRLVSRYVSKGERELAAR